MQTGPSSSTAPFFNELEPNVRLVSIITSGDTIPGSTSVFGGIPDGIGAFDNGDGTITALINHEFNPTVGLVRDHGSAGAYIDRLIIDKSSFAVVSGGDLIQQIRLWDDLNDTYFTGTTAFSRFCSGDLAESSAFFNAATGLGTQTRIYLTGEESGATGRAFAAIVDGSRTGLAFELPALGNLSFENVVANPFAQNKTIVSLTDDGTNGQVYIYVGEKLGSGSEIARAGLTNGLLYGIKVDGFADESNDIAASGHFTLAPIGPSGDASNLSGSEIDSQSETAGVTSFLRPEDSAWDPTTPNTLYFTTTNNFAGNTRVYRAEFTDISNPEAGGTITAVLDGSEGARMFDNLTVDAFGHVLLQEDPGNQNYVSRVYEYDKASDQLVPILTFDPEQFTPGANGFITQDEESSGIIDVSNLLGDADTRAYLFDAQVHSDTNDPATVEQGQLLALFVDDPVLNGGVGNDELFGSAADERLTGLGGNDRLLAGSGDDVLFGGDGNDRLEGGAGADILVGGAGNDLLIGGMGSDRLRGGAGADVFSYSSVAESTRTNADRILDFSHADGDRVDLSAIDANSSVSGNNAFTIVREFTGTAGELRIFENANGATLVSGDVDGDKVADLYILVRSDDGPIIASDFSL